MKLVKLMFVWSILTAISYGVFSFFSFIPPEVSEFNFKVMNNLKEFFQREASAASLSAEFKKPIRKLSIPERIIIPSINVDSPVLNPKTAEISVLDRALLSGVVRYPGSPGLDEDGNVFIFGHSTTFPVVRNSAFKSFNHLEKLSLGSLIIIRAGDFDYKYGVTSIKAADKSEIFVGLSVSKKIITLSTCDTFGRNAENGRIVVEARFIEKSMTGVSG